MTAIGAYAGSTAAVAVSLLIAVVAAVRGIWSPCGLSMISAINPFSEDARGHRYWLTAAWFVVGSIAGGICLGGFGAVGALLVDAMSLPTGIGVTLAALCCLVTVAGDTQLFGFGLPIHPRQVNEHWLGRYRRWVYASGFGAQIGAGLATYIMTAAVYLVPVLGALSGSWVFALQMGALFGLVRGLGVLVSAGATEPSGLRRLHRRLDRLAGNSLAAVVVAQCFALLVFAAVATGAGGLFGSALVFAVGASLVVRQRRSTRAITRCHARTDQPQPESPIAPAATRLLLDR